MAHLSKKNTIHSTGWVTRDYVWWFWILQRESVCLLLLLFLLSTFVRNQDRDTYLSRIPWIPFSTNVCLYLVPVETHKATTRLK